MTEAALGPAPTSDRVPPVATHTERVERCSDRFRAGAGAFLPAGILAAVVTVVREGPSVSAAAYLTSVCAALIMFPVARRTTLSLLAEAPVRPPDRPVRLTSGLRNAAAALAEMALVSLVVVAFGVGLDRALGAPEWPAFLAPILLGFAFLALWQGRWADAVEAQRSGVLVRPAGIKARRANAQLVPAEEPAER
ncbi:MAG: hypothetical protein JWL73_3501 [Actinomycetia bacterium]|nr:hypothetical protein [Actinomycetes bacterium]